MELDVVPSSILFAGFILLPILLACWWIWTAGHAFAVDSIHKPSNRINSASAPFNNKAALSAAVLLLIWLIFAAFVGHQDWAHTFDSFPPPGVRAFIAVIVITIILALTRPGKILALNTPLWLLTGFQAFRIPVEFLIHQAYLEKITIIEMTYLGRNFDIMTGVLALLIAIYAYKNKVSNKVILAWNILGLALLINVVSTGVMSMPHNFQLIETDKPNIWVMYFPFIWLPFVLVCSALFGHLLIFRYLLACKPKPNHPV